MNSDHLITTVHLVGGETLTHSDPINWDEVPEEAGDDLAVFMAEALQKAGVKVAQVGPHYLNWDNVTAITFSLDLEGV